MLFYEEMMLEARDLRRDLMAKQIEIPKWLEEKLAEQRREEMAANVVEEEDETDDEEVNDEGETDEEEEVAADEEDQTDTVGDQEVATGDAEWESLSEESVLDADEQGVATTDDIAHRFTKAGSTELTSEQEKHVVDVLEDGVVYVRVLSRDELLVRSFVALAEAFPGAKELLIKLEEHMYNTGTDSRRLIGGDYLKDDVENSGSDDGGESSDDEGGDSEDDKEWVPEAEEDVPQKGGKSIKGKKLSSEKDKENDAPQIDASFQNLALEGKFLFKHHKL